MKLIDVMAKACQRLHDTKGQCPDSDMVVRGIIDHALSPAGEMFDAAVALPFPGGADLIDGLEAGSQPERVIARAVCRWIYGGEVHVPSEWFREELDDVNDTAGWGAELPCAA